MNLRSGFFLFLGTFLFAIHCGPVDNQDRRAQRFSSLDNRKDEDERSRNKPDGKVVQTSSGQTAKEVKDEIEDDIKNLKNNLSAGFSEVFDIFGKNKQCKTRSSRTTIGFVLSFVNIRSPWDNALDCFQEEIEGISNKLCTARDEVNEELKKEEDKRDPNVQAIVRLEEELIEFEELEEDFRNTLTDIQDDIAKERRKTGNDVGEEVWKSLERSVASEAENYCA